MCYIFSVNIFLRETLSALIWKAIAFQVWGISTSPAPGKEHCWPFAICKFGCFQSKSPEPLHLIMVGEVRSSPAGLQPGVSTALALQKKKKQKKKGFQDSRDPCCTESPALGLKMAGLGPESQGSSGMWLAAGHTHLHSHLKVSWLFQPMSPKSEHGMSASKDEVCRAGVHWDIYISNKCEFLFRPCRHYPEKTQRHTNRGPRLSLIRRIFEAHSLP
jgi:hypothetical protein